MVADIARVTYDPTRQYRSVIYQQGRVTLEADNNEAAVIESEALRLETIDIIGPAGTPDNGYAVSSGKGPAGVVIGPGIFYLGGWRLELDAAYDMPGSANSKEDIELARSGGDFVVSLLVTEQSVSAVEDQALREVALGGPDSAARSRLMQTFPRLPITGDTCAAAATTIAGLLAEDGVTLDASYELMSSATLQADFVPGPPSTDACTPAAAGGYLGADNQMVRVTVTAFDAKKQTGTLLWGWNNASLLYRATATDPLTLTFSNAPVDQEHAPQLNQMVEILRTELDLSDGNYIADGQGFVVALTQAYSSDTGQIVLASPLPSDYQNNKNPLFVRLWQAEVDFNVGVQTPLDNVSGITVAISMTALPSHIAARPFWRFAVRPSMPQNIYPQRYYDAPQPPDGPRQWICDLAVAKALETGCTVLASCRPTFTSLTAGGGGCCGVTIGPDDAVAQGGLQAVVDSLAGAPAVLSLSPGVYDLAAPLKLGKANDGLVIESCGGGVQLKSSATDTSAFRLGLIQMAEVKNITLRSLELIPPEAPLSAKIKVSEASVVCGVAVGAARGLTVEDCTLTLSSTSKVPIGIGFIFKAAASDVTLCGNTITASSTGEFFGLLSMINENNASTQLDQWEVSNNRFTDCAAGVVVYAQLGLVSCCGNVVTNAGAGIVFMSGNQGSLSAFTREALTNTDSPQQTTLGQAGYSLLRPDILTNLVDKLNVIDPSTASAPKVSNAARKVLADQMTSSGLSMLKNLTAGLTAPGAPAGAAPADDVKGPAIDTAAFDKVDAISVAAEVNEPNITPALRIEDNEITLTNTVGIAGSTTPWVGIGVGLSPDEASSVMVSGNRVVVPDATTTACAVAFPTAAVVTGNLFAQLASNPTGAPGLPALTVMTSTPASMVSANVASYTELVTPSRASAALTTSWDFLNTTA
jgi:hypothetical protein